MSHVRADAAGQPQPDREPPSGTRGYLVRQPLFTLRSELVGYELLVGVDDGQRGEDGGEDGGEGGGEDAAALRGLIARGDLVVVLEAFADDRPVFLRVDAATLASDELRELPAETVVLQLDVGGSVAPGLLEECGRVVADGYRLALTVGAQGADAALLDLAEYTEVDFAATTPQQRADLVAWLRRHSTTIVARNVDTHEELAEAKGLGCDLAHGFFFHQPQRRGEATVPAHARSHLQLLAEMQREELDYPRVARLVKQDVDLAYKFLTYLNSAALGLRRRIESLEEALVLLGERRVRRWVQAAAVQHLTPHKPTELTVNAAIRAQLCETIGRELGLGSRSLELFTVGLFSLADAMFDRPMEKALRGVPITDEVRRTLLGERTAFSDPLELVVAYERGDWRQVDLIAERLGRPEAPFFQMYSSALLWAHEVFDTV